MSFLSRLSPLHHITGSESSWSDFAQLPLIVLISPQLLPTAPIYFSLTLRSHEVGTMGRTGRSPLVPNWVIKCYSDIFAASFHKVFENLFPVRFRSLITWYQSRKDFLKWKEGLKLNTAKIIQSALIQV